MKEATLLLVAHYLEEALQLCDRFIILKEGQIIADLKKSDLIQEDFSYLECSMNISDFEEYRIKEYQYKIPKKLAAEALVRFSKEIVLYQKDYRIDLEELLS